MGAGQPAVTALCVTLLDSCQVTWQEQPLSVPRRQTRALLYYLATRLEPVARARLTFLFWPDIPDATARRQLTRLVSSLRADLPHPALPVVDEGTISLKKQAITLAAARWNSPTAYDPTFDVAPPFGSPIDILDITAVAGQWDTACPGFTANYANLRQ